MQHCYCFEMIHQMMINVCESKSLFDSCLMLLSDDFAQILLIVQHVKQAATVTVNLQKSFLWSSFTALFLQQNMQIIADINNQNFAAWLNHLSYDTELHKLIKLLFYIQHENDLNCFCLIIYLNDVLINDYNNTKLFVDVVILSSVNSIINKFNNHLLHCMLSDVHEYLSVNEIVLSEKEENFETV